MKLTVVNIPNARVMLKPASGGTAVVNLVEGQEIDTADLAAGESERLQAATVIRGGQPIHIFGEAEAVAAHKSKAAGNPVPKAPVATPAPSPVTVPAPVAAPVVAPVSIPEVPKAQAAPEAQKAQKSSKPKKTVAKKKKAAPKQAADNSEE